MQITSISAFKQKANGILNFGEAKRKQRPTPEQFNDLRVFYHHIYEYKKGLRSLVLTTEKASNRDVIENRLKKENIPYLINEVGNKNINVFFGNPDCIKVVKTLDKKLDKITPEQDFMLGIMLGYDKILQCQRYFVMRDKYIKRLEPEHKKLNLQG